MVSMSRRRPLSHLLLASHVGLVLLFSMLLLATAIGTIRSAVVAQARSEAEQTVSEARRRLQEWQRELDVGADLLAEQPTLRFYLQRGQLTKARELVRDFHATSELDFVRVEMDARVVSQAGQPPPTLQPGLAFDAGGTPWRIVRRELEPLPGARIVVAEQLGGRLREAGGNARALVALHALSAPAQAADEDWGKALQQVAASGDPDTFEGVGGAAAARVVGLRDGNGALYALMSARIPRDWVDRRILEWFAAFGLSGLFTLAIALGLAFLVARRVGRPFAELAQEAARLGSGDLETPVATPDTLLVEPAALADGLERMRGRVSALTATERNQREQLDAVLDGVDEGIVGIDAANLVHYANRQFLALVGREREEVLGHPISGLMQPVGSGANELDGIPELGAARMRYAATGSLRPLIVRRQFASGQQHVLVVREENAIEAARAMRDRILANLSHEFQTPLSAQLASIEMLRDHLRGSADSIAVQLADAQYRGSLRLSQLVDNLLDSVRIESGEMRLRRQAVDLESIVADAVELVRPLTDQREQRVLADLVPGPPIVGDAPRLFSVMVNLLANANKFAPDRSCIRVAIERGPGHATVWVEDEGPGLPLMHGEADLFAPFRRSPDDEPGQRGTGLGLAIVKAIAVAHGGDVLVSARAEGHGAKVGVQLPVGGEE
jgi:signal transduction histidine kinase/HAMP domain-containing protein